MVVAHIIVGCPGQLAILQDDHVTISWYDILLNGFSATNDCRSGTCMA